MKTSCWNRAPAQYVSDCGGVTSHRPVRLIREEPQPNASMPLPEVCVTPQEQQLLVQLTQRINQTQLQEKDPDAENLLGRELGANPDAVYILAQTALVQNIALDQARAQITQLQQQIQQARQQPAHSTSFLGRLLGEHDQSATQGAPQQQPAQYQPGQTPPHQPVPPSPYPPPPQYQQSQFTAPPPGQPSFLRGAMQTAAGVAAGALAFEGVESLLHGFGHVGYGTGFGMSGFGMGPGMGMMGGFDRPVEETVVNNYYDQPNPEQHLNTAGSDQGSHDLTRQGSQFTDASFNSAGNDPGNQGNDDASLVETSYDSSADNVQFDDSGQLDESGSFEDGGGFDDGGNDLS